MLLCERYSNDENIKSGEIFKHFLGEMNESQVNHNIMDEIMHTIRAVQHNQLIQE